MADQLKARAAATLARISEQVEKNPPAEKLVPRLRAENAALATELETLRTRAEKMAEALAMAVSEMSRARGRLETIAMCNEDRRIAASLGATCDFIRSTMRDNPGADHD